MQVFRRRLHGNCTHDAQDELSPSLPVQDMLPARLVHAAAAADTEMQAMASLHLRVHCKHTPPAGSTAPTAAASALWLLAPSCAGW
jgi:hypothetical protein